VTAAGERVVGLLRRGRIGRYPLGALAIIAAFLFMGAFAPLLTRYEPNLPELSERLQAPSEAHRLGTDSLGRDILTRLFYGARTTMKVTSLTLLIGGVAGLVLGMLAGYLGGAADAIVARLMDVFLAFPVLFFGLLFAVTLGPGLFSVVASISLVLWARVGRVVRAETIAVKDREYIQSARVSDASTLRIIVRHILPNVMPTFIVLVSINLGTVVLSEAALSFLGAGVPLPNASWGSMITEGQKYITRAWWIAVVPGAAITLSVLAINLFGDWLRDFLDPELRQQL